MTAETRELILQNIENALKLAGSPDYDTGIATVSRLLDWCKQHIDMVRTKHHLAVILESLPAMDAEQEAMALACTALLPQLVVSTIGDLAKGISSDFRLPTAGRPTTLGSNQRLQLVKYVGEMHLQGYSLLICKRRAAGKFGVSVRTVERAWQDRARLIEGHREISFQEAKQWLVNMLNGGEQRQIAAQEGARANDTNR